MQEIISILKFIITSNTLNFVIMVLLLAYLVKRFALSAAFDKSIESVKSSIAKSDDEKKNSQVLLRKAEDLMQKLPEDIKTMEDNTKAKVEVFKDKIEKDTTKSISNINNNINRVVSIEEKKISNLLTNDASQASVDAARQHIIRMLNENPDLHSKFIQNSLDELDRISL